MFKSPFGSPASSSSPTRGELESTLDFLLSNPPVKLLFNDLSEEDCFKDIDDED